MVQCRSAAKGASVSANRGLPPLPAWLLEVYWIEVVPEVGPEVLTAARRSCGLAVSQATPEMDGWM